MAPASQPEIRPIDRWSPDALADGARALSHRLAPWAQGWGVPAVCEPISLSDVQVEAGPCEWSHGRATDGAAAWLGWPRDGSALAAQALFRTCPPGSVLAREVAGRCVLDARRAVEEVLGVTLEHCEPDAVRAWLARRWCGAGAWHLPLGGRLLLATPFKSKLAIRRRGGAEGVRPRLQPLGEAMQTQAVSVEVQLASFDIRLGALQSLCTDDVLVLSHPLDEPPALVAPGMSPMKARLGRQGRRMAVTTIRTEA